MLKNMNKFIRHFGSNKYETFTKIWMNRLMWFFCAWVTCSYVLAFLGKDNIALGLSKIVVTAGIGGFASYMAKSYFETKEQEKNKIKSKNNKEEEGVE